MSANSRSRSRRRYPLHITISVAFAVLLALFGFALIGFNYVEGRRAALLKANDLVARIDAHMQMSVEGLYAPIANVVDVASKTLPDNTDSTDQGVRALGFASEVLRIKPEIASIFVGYEDGDFYQLRLVSSWPGMEDVVVVPEDATFALESLERQDEPPAARQWLFYDDDLQLVGSGTSVWSGYDPRQRQWYRTASEATGQIATRFYRFHTTGEIGATVARRLGGGHGVVGADITLKQLSAGLLEQHPTPSSRIAMLRPDGTVIALPEVELHSRLKPTELGQVEMPHLTDLDDPVYRELAKLLATNSDNPRMELTADGRTWLVSLSELPMRWGRSFLLATIIPRDELLADVIRARDTSVQISLGLLLVTLLVVVVLSRHISESLRKLAREAEHIRELRLDMPLTVHSSIQEVEELASTMSVMKSSLQRFLAISHALSAEKDFDALLEMILDETRRVSGAEGGGILLRSEDGEQLEAAILQRPGEDGPRRGAESRHPIPLDDRAQSKPSIERTAAIEGSVARVDDASAESRYDLGAARARFEVGGVKLRSVLCVPLLNPQEEVIGILQLVNARGRDGEVAAFRDATVPYIEALSSDAAIALENRRLLQAQKDLLESFIHMVAGAIDAKSPYTHGHCQRVPVIARMLAEAAHESEDGPFAGFRLSDDERYALHLASWLHDCGKVTTPEYVVDKASKLETIYNRIHELRMRFEVLLRDAEIEYLRARETGVAGEAELRSRLEARRAQVRDDFAFIAECNGGDSVMTDEKVERIRRIGEQTWLRHLDDRLGLAHGELRNKPAGPQGDDPVPEPLLADKPEHVVPRAADPFGDNQHGFRMDVPEHLYNQGEIHNLCIRRGTLTNEERFKINEHVVQTIRMLGRLPFPRELRQVPDWAGNHHEKLDGTGYPRKVQAEELAIPERILAVADVFEALTAMDRPYLPPKKLSRAIGIMNSMTDEGHLCPDLFELLLRSGVFNRYAEQYMQPEQLDEVDVETVLGKRMQCDNAGSCPPSP